VIPETSCGAIDELGHLIAEASKNVVFVVGAGMSKPAGVPDWTRLLQRLMDAALQYLRENEDVPQPQREATEARLRGIRDPWLLGDAIQATLPHDRYLSVVKAALRAKAVPEAYRLLWALRPSGVISFNLDPLAEEAMGETRDQVATAREVAKYRRFLLSRRPFLLQPHGSIVNYTSWVLGAQARNALLKGQDYRDFLKAVLSSRRLVIVGFQPRDLAFESLLLDDFREAADGGLCHFWITPLLDAEAREFASLYNLCPIEYEPADDGHPEVAEILRRLATYEPRSSAAPLAYTAQRISLDELPPDESLRGELVESIRRKLNAALVGVMQDAVKSGADQTTAIADFFHQFSGSARMAWHVVPDSPYAIVWGYKAHGPLGDGAFSSVWRVTDIADGSVYALKLMREEISRDLRMFEAFRRGVQAMRILAEHRVKGMVGLRDAFDIPACVVMDYVAGETLYDAMASGLVDSLSMALRIVHRVGSIVLEGHRLPERVLHRDLKPTNVMLRRTHGDDPSAEVVVLDFDLSWYEGAIGHSMLPGLRMANYQAPEQTRPAPRRYSSRHTAVDVFGIGMLLYYVATGTDPEMNVQNTSEFQAKTTLLVRDKWQQPFASVAEAIARLVVAATLDDQPERISLPSLLDAIQQIADCLDKELMPVPSDLALLELASALPDGTWRREAGEAGAGALRLKSKISGAQVDLSFEGDRPDPGLRVVITYAEGGAEPRANVHKYLAKKSDQAAAGLKRGGAFAEVESGGLRGTAEASGVVRGPDWDLERAHQLKQALAAAAAKMQMD
jgi:serine/threonine protein kinase